MNVGNVFDCPDYVLLFRVGDGVLDVPFMRNVN